MAGATITARGDGDGHGTGNAEIRVAPASGVPVVRRWGGTGASAFEIATRALDRFEHGAQTGSLRVSVVRPGASRTIARCPACGRSILRGALLAGYVELACRHCRLVVRVDAPAPRLLQADSQS